MASIASECDQDSRKNELHFCLQPIISVIMDNAQLLMIPADS